jgi:hypothetical protein
MEESPTTEDVVARVRTLNPSQRRAAMASLDALVRLETPLSALDEDRLTGLPDVPADALREEVATR